MTPSRRLAGLVLAGLMVLGLAACETASDGRSDLGLGEPGLGEPGQGDPGQVEGVQGDGGQVEGGLQAASQELGDDVRVLDLPVPVGGAGAVEVDIRPGDTSVLLVVTAAEVTDRVYIDAAISPSGTTIDPDQVENAGQNALLVPAVDDGIFEAGTWTFEIDADGEIAQVQAVVKSSDPFGEQVVDAVFYVVSRTADPDDVAAAVDAWAERGEEILRPHGLGVGTLTIAEVPSALVDAHASLTLIDDNDPPLRELCQALADLEGRSRRLVFGIIDEVVDDDGEQDGTEGIAAGSPGSAVVGGATSCVTIAADSGRDLDELGTTVWHEAGHSLGLLHTTEAEGDVFDELADTPECDAGNDTDGDGFVSDLECAELDGGNFMFHDSDGTAMTEGQAFVLRNHPLLQPPA